MVLSEFERRTSARVVMAEKQEIVKVGNSNHDPNSPASTTDSTSEARSSECRSNPDGFPNFTPLSLLNASSAVPSSSTYTSTRIARMLQSRSAFATDIEFEIEASKVHWSELQSSSVVHQTRAAEQASADEETHLTNAEILQRLRNQWPGIFRDWGNRLEVGAKIAEGAQAELFEARIARPDAMPDGDFNDVVKVFKEGASLQELQRQWPPGMLTQWNEHCLMSEYLSTVWGGTLLSNGRFAFYMTKFWGDLRKLIDLRMQGNGNRSSPFSASELELNMKHIAMGMEKLSKCNVVHRDLKASNVLIHASPLKEFDPTLGPRDLNGRYWCAVADYECSVGVVGTGFWRAPEVLQGVKDRNITPDLFTEAADVYSFAMTCYELITGQLPFEDVLLNNYDVVLEGGRPILLDDVEPWIRELLNRCWDPNPLERPSFKKIVRFIRFKNDEDLSSCRQDIVCRRDVIRKRGVVYNWFRCLRF